MKFIGIIAEYNPFHNGHLYHLNKIKELYPDYGIVVVVGSCFMQRGEPSILNKWNKTNICLEMGIDLVVELPFVFATQSADIFAKGSIQILKELNVEKIVFGSELNNIKKLEELADIQLNNQEYDTLIKKYLDEGVNYPKALSMTLKSLTTNIIDTPNDLLGISYIKQIKIQKTNIEPVSIKRTNDYHDLSLDSDITSASAIRQALKNKQDVQKQLPSITFKYLTKDFPFLEDYFSLIKYKIISDIKNLNQYQTVDEGIENRIKKVIYNSKNIEELIMNIKTKRYTYNKIRRMLIHILVSFTKEEAKRFQNVEYIRILGFNEIGRKYLNLIKNKTKIPIITNYSNIKNDLLNLEFRANAIYCIIFENSKLLIEEEYKNKPIYKK